MNKPTDPMTQQPGSNGVYCSLRCMTGPVINVFRGIPNDAQRALLPIVLINDDMLPEQDNV